MLNTLRGLIDHRELVAVLAWKNIVVRYKQAYLGIAWAILKPLMLVMIFALVRSFVGIDSGGIPYPVLTFAALLPWTFFQESTSDGVNSVVGNAHLIKKIYFPREIFPLTAVFTKLVELGINFVVLTLLMVWYGMLPSAQVLWVPLLVIYTVLVSLTASLAGSALNVYFRDVANMLPVLISLLMYVSPVIYPLALVKDKLLVQRAAGEWSDLLYTLYMLNPMAGIIDGFQNAVLRGLPPDPSTLWPGLLIVAVLLPLSYAYFKRAEAQFADVV